MQNNEENLSFPNNDKGLQLFNFNNSPVRTLTDKKGDTFFVASDVCKILEISNVAQALTRLDEDEKSIIILNEYGRNYEKPIINESGLYSLVLSSRKPEAKAFKKWVTSEVLPQIRKTGSYALTPPQKSTFELMAEAFAEMARIEREQQNTTEKVGMLESAIKEVSAKITTIDTNFYSVVGFCKLKHIQVDETLARRIGVKARKYSKQIGSLIGKVYDAKFGEINTYHAEILESILVELGLLNKKGGLL